MRMGQTGPFQSSWQNSNSSAEAVWSPQSLLAQSSGFQQVHSHNHGRLRRSFTNSSNSGQSSGEASYHNLSSNSNRISGLVDHKQVEDAWGNIG